jgi:hypothetical protein
VETTQKSIGSVSIKASAENTEKDLVLFVFGVLPNNLHPVTCNLSFILTISSIIPALSSFIIKKDGISHPIISLLVHKHQAQIRTAKRSRAYSTMLVEFVSVIRCRLMDEMVINSLKLEIFSGISA